MDLRPGTDPPWIIAHRGASAVCPENTLNAFDEALKSPINAIELDVQRSADGAAVVYHDRTLGRLGAPRRRVCGMTLKQLQRLDAGTWFDPTYAGVSVVTLDQALSRYGNRVNLMVEIKERGGRPSAAIHQRLARQVADQIINAGLTGRVFILCFGLEVLRAGASHAPALPYVWNLRKPPPLTAHSADLIAPFAALCCKINTLTAPFVAWAHGQGKPVLSYTVNDADTLDKAMNAGVDGLISDHPAWLIAQMKKGLG